MFDDSTLRHRASERLLFRLTTITLEKMKKKRRVKTMSQRSFARISPANSSIVLRAAVATHEAAARLSRARVHAHLLLTRHHHLLICSLNLQQSQAHSFLLSIQHLLQRLVFDKLTKKKRKSKIRTASSCTWNKLSN